MSCVYIYIVAIYIYSSCHLVGKILKLIKFYDLSSVSGKDSCDWNNHLFWKMKLLKIKQLVNFWWIIKVFHYTYSCGNNGGSEKAKPSSPEWAGADKPSLWSGHMTELTQQVINWSKVLQSSWRNETPCNLRCYEDRHTEREISMGQERKQNGYKDWRRQKMK